jgi:predicted glutamine amidotransferase
VLLDNFLYQPDSALVRQSYMPKMLNMLNLAGFGLRAWDPRSHAPDQPFFYGSPSLPVFDRNLKNLAEKVRAGCVLAHVRGVAYSTAVEISLQNVHPVQFDGLPWALAHNGELAAFEEMKPLLTPHVTPALRGCIRGTTDSEWLYALFVSQLDEPAAPAPADAVFSALEGTFSVLHEARRALGVDTASSANLFIANGRQLAAVRYCFDFGRYGTDELSRVQEPNSGFLSLWYTLGRDYRLHDGEWQMTGGAERADSILVASEPLTRDSSSWVELPEYGALFADMREGRPRVSVKLLD